jgi:hypothetical protein
MTDAVTYTGIAIAVVLLVLVACAILEEWLDHD